MPYPAWGVISPTQPQPWPPRMTPSLPKYPYPAMRHESPPPHTTAIKNEIQHKTGDGGTCTEGYGTRATAELGGGLTLPVESFECVPQEALDTCARRQGGVEGWRDGGMEGWRDGGL